MDEEREKQRKFAEQYLRLCGWFIILMGIVGIGMYYFDIANTQNYPVIVAGGTIFCIYGAWMMFHLARRVEANGCSNVKYRNSRWGFQLDLLDGWRQAGLLRKLIFAGNPEFYGPSGASIKFAIGPINPVPSVEQQKRNLERIAAKYGHIVLSTGEIQISGKSHATMICTIPYVGTVKNYSLIFSGIEYLVIASGDFDVSDSILKTFKVA